MGETHCLDSNLAILCLLKQAEKHSIFSIVKIFL